MAKFIRKEQNETMMDYVNVPDASAGSALHRCSDHSDGATAAAASGIKLYRLVAVSFGLLCLLQAALNVSLRLSSDTSCTNLTDGLKTQLINFDHYLQQGWVYFHPSLYYISSVRKSWQESRQDCQQKGADLVIINSKEEQDFTRLFHKLTWIGLRKAETNRTWKWVDGSMLTKSYWGSGEPNSFEGKTEECVEIKFHDVENSWNDIPCADHNYWICEKTTAL